MLCVVKKRKKFFPKTLNELKHLCDLGVPLWKIDFPKEIRSIRGLFYKSPRTYHQYDGIEEWDFNSIVDWTSAFEEAFGFNRTLNGFRNAKILDNCFKNAINFSQSFSLVSFHRLKSAENALLNTRVEETMMGKLTVFALKEGHFRTQEKSLF